MKKLTQLVNDLKTNALKHDFECGWMRDETINLICAYLKFYKPDVVIHTGFLWGKSSAFICDAISNYDLKIDNSVDCRDYDYTHFVDRNTPQNKHGYLIAVDPNIFELDIEEAEKLINSVYGNLTLYKTTSKNFFSFYYPKLEIHPNCLVGIVDGDHTNEGCYSDLVHLGNLGAKLILVDDTIWLSSLKEVCKKFAEEFNYDFLFVDLYSGLGVLIRK